jgi:large subunit ribosomal protein L28
MARRCDLCGKSPQYGNNVSHSKVRTARRWLPNLQHTTVRVGGRTRRLTVCTRCLRSTAHRLTAA